MVLPEPLGPRRARRVPCRIVRVRPGGVWPRTVLGPYFTVTEDSSIRGSPCFEGDGSDVEGVEGEEGVRCDEGWRSELSF